MRGNDRAGWLSLSVVIPTVPLALVTGCSVGPAPRYGLVTGLAAPCVGAVLQPATTESVTVYASRGGHVIQSDRVRLNRALDSPFRLRLPAGDYTLSAPQSYLPTQPISVQPGQTVHASFVAHCK
jgi:hypothetical protein